MLIVFTNFVVFVPERTAQLLELYFSCCHYCSTFQKVNHINILYVWAHYDCSF